MVPQYGGHPYTELYSHDDDDRNSAYRMNVAFYKVFTDDNEKNFKLSVPIICTYTLYLQDYGLYSVRESFLLYKPPGKDANNTLVVKLLSVIRAGGSTSSACCEDNFMKLFQQWTSLFPAVAALLDKPLRELSPDRDDKVRICAYPGCNIDGKGLFSKMMKCGRCRSVYYCGLEHQKEHWKVHNQAVKALLLQAPIQQCISL